MTVTRAPIAPVLGSWITRQASMGTVFFPLFLYIQSCFHTT
jgi:hypothetical protein